MTDANVIFTLNGINLTIQCTIDDKMEDICKNYSIKINKNMNFLSFLYRENKVIFDLSFKEQANIIDRNNHEMKILVNKIENNTKSFNNIIIISNTIDTKSNSGKAYTLKSVTIPT